MKLWYSPPKILNYIVAYDGPNNMKKVYNWIKKLEGELKFEYPSEMPPDQQKRIDIPSPGMDGIFVLGKGYVHFDNFIISHINPNYRNKDQWMRWIFLDSENASLLLLFLNLATLVCSYPQKAVNLLPYLKDIHGKLQWGK